MKRVATFLLNSLLFLLVANLDPASALAQKGPQQIAEVADTSTANSLKLMLRPQEFVVCTGWHALCSASYDCQINGDTADCDCYRVNETHIVQTSAILDPEVKRRTDIKCTKQHPCEVDEAPVCEAIKDGQYKVDNVKYQWVSTFSYRGWCTLLEVTPAACDPIAPHYTGDSAWAVCDAAPCTEIENPSNPEKPLSCHCPIKKTAFLGTNGTCTGDNGGIMSSSPLWTWDFQTNSYRIPLPGMEYVQGACAPLKSDPVQKK
ncbi:hypothetical protein [Geomonas sp.]|uniref:hypothetical protein n=1 Tax=Geomonas sp. TaxID=2651584 RepID=UPI002B4825B5|nr:hypothetical protein [Geomonas sp.]HJV34617.1 hypothetical protein [Geomonas sp.]